MKTTTHHAKLQLLAKQADKEYQKAHSKWLVASKARTDAWVKLTQSTSKLLVYERKHNL